MLVNQHPHTSTPPSSPPRVLLTNTLQANRLVEAIAKSIEAQEAQHDAALQQQLNAEERAATAREETNRQLAALVGAAVRSADALDVMSAQFTRLVNHKVQ